TTHDATLPDLLVGEKAPVRGAVVVVNATGQPSSGLTLLAKAGGASLSTPLPPIPPLSIRKAGFRIPAPARKAGETVAVELLLRRGQGGGGRTLHSARVDLAVRGPGDHHKRTFTSDIDGSVQYYSVRPARPGAADRSRPGLVLSLHGASVEATG